ncbi:DUF669 domain-containing protein [Alkalicoccus luteus]|uniref:DUF669 domain-containing protein n=1 Tax=Alkalicoccus luteus TaxID=1237094 RepID=A0A969PPS0_9BACI|nr:DUF669 domain-containing protein [Alkalicoccus luteus]NJP37168.1 DUF669 domain-containing protein [Alkalicoccus luteus]
MVFQLDHEDVYEGGIKDGEYEVIIKHAKEDATQSGAEYAEFDLVVRNDLEQKHKNQHIFHKVWKKKDTGKYNMKMFNTMGKACQLQNGKQYKSMQELLDDFAGKVAIVSVKNEESEYNGQTYNNLNVKSWKQSKFPNSQHQFQNSDRQDHEGQSVQVNDSEMPF